MAFTAADIQRYRKGGQGFVDWAEKNVRIPIYAPGAIIPDWVLIGELPDTKHAETGRSPAEFWHNMANVVKKALVVGNDGLFVYRLIVLCWMRGESKCEKKGSKIIYFDGSVRKVEDVKVGDLLMGDSNTPRKVLSLTSGKEEMFEVVPMRGESMVVTADHQLSLKRRCVQKNKRGKPYNDIHAGKIIDITVREVIKKSKSWRGLNLLYRVPLNWPEQAVPLDPYFLGIWLSDGTSTSPHITTMNKEVVDYLYALAVSMSMRVTVHTKPNNKASTYSLVTDKGKKNPLLDLLRDNNLAGNKHIPNVYKINSREMRLKLLSGLVDGDGCINRNSICIIQKRKKLSEDILFLARSLGLHAEMKQFTAHIKSIGFSGEYYRIGISGDCSIIPTIVPGKKCLKRSDWKDVLVTGIQEIKSVGEQEYYGFTLTGNGRYVKGDFTVTHNSLLTCLIQMWKFYCFPKQLIVLGANSKDQVKFVHFDIIKDIILNSPKLLAITGRKNIQEKEIRLKNKAGAVMSTIRSISSFSGIVSNITGYTFSEIFDLKNSKFFYQLDGSIRNIPNALGIIDSTVSVKRHILYRLFTIWEKKKDPTLFFSYRFSLRADYRDYWHPAMTKKQLNSYRIKFPRSEFDQYFKNTWESASKKLFSPTMIKATHFIGFGKQLGMHNTIIKALSSCLTAHNDIRKIDSGMLPYEDTKIINSTMDRARLLSSIKENLSGLKKLSDVYKLTSTNGMPRMASREDLGKLSDLYDTDWALLVGLDRSDPLKIQSGARTILSAIVKGLPGSRSNPELMYNLGVKSYIYFIVHLANIASARIDDIKLELASVHSEFDGIETVCGERWGLWDLGTWCTENDVLFLPVQPTRDRQKEAFTELYQLYNSGLFKTPPIAVLGSKGKDILVEEALYFDYSPKQGVYGSPEKDEKYGVQDDAMYAVGWGVWGGKNISAEDFRSRTSEIVFGEFRKAPDLVGRY